MFVYRISLLIYLVYIGYLAPLSPLPLQRDEMINGVFLLLSSMMMPLYTDFVLDPEVRYTLGWSQVGLISAQFSYIIGQMLWLMLKCLINGVKRLYRRIWGRSAGSKE